jgi:hypothetical protein
MTILRKMIDRAMTTATEQTEKTPEWQKNEEKKRFMVKTTAVKTSKAWYRLAFFALLVMTMVTGTLHLTGQTAQAAQANMSWTAPSLNTAGAPVTNLAGYKVYVGSSSGNYQQKIDVGNLTNYTVNNLTDGSTYYFAVTAYDTSGLESSFSSEVSKNFPAAPVTYTITATAGSGGTITALNNSNVSNATTSTSTVTSVTVTSGSSQSFSIAPASGYTLQGVTVDGASVGAVTSYSFSNVTANHTIAATFAATPVTYTITASAGTGGSITPSGTVKLNAGASQSYSIAAATGYKIAGVTVDGASVGAVSSYTFSNLAANHTISATFAASTTVGTTVFATNCGGASYTDAAGVVYKADVYYSGGNAGTTPVTISGTNDQSLYQSERWSSSSYNIPLTNGNYTLTLKFAENYWSAIGKRVFDVAVGGQTVISGLDVYAKVGKYAAYDVAVPVTVSNGTLSINFINKIDNASIHAIKVVTR